MSVLSYYSPDMEYVVDVVSSHIVQPMFDQLLKVGQVPVLSELLVIWRWVSHHQVQIIMVMSTGHMHVAYHSESLF